LFGERGEWGKKLSLQIEEEKHARGNESTLQELILRIQGPKGGGKVFEAVNIMKKRILVLEHEIPYPVRSRTAALSESIGKKRRE